MIERACLVIQKSTVCIALYIYVGDVGTSDLSFGRSQILGLEVTRLVAERSHGHGMNVFT